MKTDRELLELAAKAAGYKIEWRDWITSRVADFGTIKHTRREGFWLSGIQWNPLTDDGDALRLAVKLMLFDSDLFMNLRLDETRKDPSRNDYEITRRAIVRAAAAIGETL